MQGSVENILELNPQVSYQSLGDVGCPSVYMLFLLANK